LVLDRLAFPSALEPLVEGCRQARAGSINDKIDGKWQEFGYKAGTNQEAYACLYGCSSDPDSEPLGNNTSPWTVKSSSSCLQLEVMEGYGGGQAVFEVFNNEASLGKTPDIPLAQGSTSCDADPYGCNLEAGVSKGAFVLQKGVPYNLHIVALRSDTSSIYGTDGGWFRLKTLSCQPNGQCANVEEKCGKAKHCCDGLGLECLPSTGSSGGRTCQTAVPPSVCALVKEACGQGGVPCCAGLECHLSQATGARTCRKSPVPPQVCANAQEACGNGVACCGSLVCHLHQATGVRTCRMAAKCAKANHRCGKGKKCCKGLVCRRSKANGRRRCRKKNSNLATCAEAKEPCGNGVNCCDGLACRPDKGTGKRKCRHTKNGGGGGGGGTTMSTGDSGGGGGGNGGSVGVAVGPMGIGVP
jgi:hypothetical protein